MDNAIAKAVDKLATFGRLKRSEESIIAAADSIGCDNQFLIANCHYLGIHCDGIL